MILDLNNIIFRWPAPGQRRPRPANRPFPPVNLSERKMILDLNNIKDIVTKEGLEVLVVSYGGSASNTLVDQLQKEGYICRTVSWCNLLCHCPKYVDIDIPIIYIYDNIIKSFLSMKNRGIGFWDVNQKKLCNNLNEVLSDENLIKLMIGQFKSWTTIKKDNVLVIKTCELFENNIVKKIENLLKRKVNHFPILYKSPNTHNENMNKYVDDNIELLNKYKLEIDMINNFIT